MTGPGESAVIVRSAPVPDVARCAALMRTTVDAPPPATQRLPALSNAMPWGALMPPSTTPATGDDTPGVSSADPAIFTTLSSPTIETQRLPSASNASAVGPGNVFPNDGLSMMTSGVFTPSLPSAAAGMRATGGSAVVPPMTQALPNTSKVKPSEPPVFATTVATDGPLESRSAGTNERSVAPDGVLLAPIHSAPLLAMRE